MSLFFTQCILNIFSDKKRRLYDNPIKPSKDGDFGKSPFSFQSKSQKVSYSSILISRVYLFHSCDPNIYRTQTTFYQVT